MRVVVSAAARFWAFHLARNLEKKGFLKCLFTPAFLHGFDNLPSKKVESMFFLKFLRFPEIFMRLIPPLGKYVDKLINYRNKRHDLYVSEKLRSLDGVDIFVGWSGQCLSSLKTAKRHGLISVLECGSTHPLAQLEIVRKEYKKVLKKDFAPGKERSQGMKRMLKEIEICDYIAIPSRFVERSFLQKGVPRKKILRIPYGADQRIFKKVKKQDDKFRVIFCGSICIRKGIHYLLKAFYDLNLPNSELLLIGYIDEEMQGFIERYNRGNVKAIGPRPQSSLYKYYSQGSIFVHPSIEEGLSMVQLEAMACGLPLICTTNTGGEDVLTEGKDGFVVPIRDVKALKKKIQHLYDNPSLIKIMSKNAMMKARQFTWEVYGERVFDAYSKILDKNGMNDVNTVKKHGKSRR